MDKRISNIEKVKIGKNFCCACGCGKKCIKKNNNDKFGRILGEKNCKINIMVEKEKLSKR